MRIDNTQLACVLFFYEENGKKVSIRIANPTTYFY